MAQTERIQVTQTERMGSTRGRAFLVRPGGVLVSHGPIVKRAPTAGFQSQRPKGLHRAIGPWPRCLRSELMQVTRRLSSLLLARYAGG